MAKSRKPRVTGDLASAIASLKETKNFYQDQGKVRTGILPFDDLFQGGLPIGKIIEFASREGVGKSTMLMSVSRELCSQGHSVIYIDSEYGVNESQLDGIGLTPYVDKNFHLIQEQTFASLSDIMDALLPHRPLLVIIDSFTALRPKKIEEENVEDVQPGLQSRLQSTFLQKYTGQIAEAGGTMILVNQMRTKLNFRGMSSEGPGGGNALKFYTSARFMIRRTEMLKRKDPNSGEEKEYGADCIIEPSKNRISGFLRIPMTVLFGIGVSNVAYLQERLKLAGFLSQSSSYFKFNTPKVETTVQGRENVLNTIKANYDYFTELIRKQDMPAELVKEEPPSPPDIEAEEEMESEFFETEMESEPSKSGPLSL